jgi:hypothetical protein
MKRDIMPWRSRALERMTMTTDTSRADGPVSVGTNATDAGSKTV